jgi:Tol biopolymer transport system component
MKLRILLAGLIAILICGSAALAADSGAEYQKAVTLERAGKLDDAIKLYQSVAKEFASDRALAAKALVAAAHCYDLQGESKHDKAIELYNQVANKYQDQAQPAAAANAWLTALRQANRPTEPATMTQRRIELPFDSADPNFPTDGKHEVYKDAATGALMITDLAGKEKRVIFKPKTGDRVYGYFPSRDFSMVAVGFARADKSDDKTPEIPLFAVIKTDGTYYRETRGTSCRPSWSWDNRYVLICERQPDGTTQLLRFSATEGSMREVLRLDKNTFRGASFSPDGRFIAYAVSGGATPESVFVLPSQGGEPQLISGSATTLLDWTRDGRYLAVAGPRSGAGALQLLPVKDGKPAGEPVFVRYGSFLGGSTLSNGALMYNSYPERSLYPAWIADVDPEGHPGEWKPFTLDTSGGGGLWPAPTFSTDSSQIAYVAERRDAGQLGYSVQLRNLATGTERQLYSGTGRMYCFFAIGGRPNLFCSEAAGAATNIFSIAVDSGNLEKLGSVQAAGFLCGRPSPDGRAVYFCRTTGEQGLIRWDIGTHQETLLEPLTSFPPDSAHLSWDGNWLRRIANGNLEIRSLSGGEWKPLLPLRAGSQSIFSADGRSIYYHNTDAAGKDGLYRVAISGGTPERVGDFPTSRFSGGLFFSQDGNKVIAETDVPGVKPETFLLENFEPKQPAAK